MALGLKLGGARSKNMSILDKQKAIKQSADAAMAAARGSTNWSRAILASLSKLQGKCEANTRREYKRPSNPCSTLHAPRSKSILRRSTIEVRSRKRKGGHACLRGVPASVLARSMVKKRTRLLRGLIPGAKSLDYYSLLGETIDYVISLRAQVDAMQLLTDSSNLKSSTEGEAFQEIKIPFI